MVTRRVLVALFLVAGVGVGSFAVSADGDSRAVGTELLSGTDPLDADTDDDGLLDGEEVDEYGTDPTEADTDDDGLLDGAEVDEYGTDPTEADTDGDGLDDGPEVREYGTDPTETDTDGDGLDDGAEVDEYDTDPTETDTDDDGLPDGTEVREYGTDPTETDTDGDGLGDGAEVREYGTDPAVADSDGDGLDDGAEIEEYGTGPLDPDTDGDGLDDGAEVREYGTDPLVADTDGDGLGDGAEVAGETDSGVALPGADPLSMDLYVQFTYAQGVERKGEFFLFDVKRNWAQMPVENPDGTTGIDLHIRQGGYLDGSPAFDGGNFWRLRAEYYREALGERAGVYHQTLFLPFESDVGYDGYGAVPGYFTVVDTTARSTFQRNMVVHELLHNVLGDLDVPEACPDDDHHLCADGWLRSVVTTNEDEFLPASLAEEIERNGFES